MAKIFENEYAPSHISDLNKDHTKFPWQNDEYWWQKVRTTIAENNSFSFLLMLKFYKVKVTIS